MKRLVLVLLAGCAHAPPPAAPPPPAPVATTAAEPDKPHGSRGAAEPVALPHRIVDQAAQSVEEAKLPARIAGARVIYVGEEHSNPHHHAAQLEVLERVYAQDAELALGFEMLPQTAQADLDAYLRGELDDKAFAEKVEWKKTWGYPFGLYKPLFQFARDHKLPAFALNAPRELARAVSHDTLTDEQKKQLPEMKPGPAAHRELVREAFGGHPHRRFADARFELFYRAQLVWGESMAERTAAALKANKRIIVFAGDGHVRRWAVPERAARRGAKPYLIVLPVLESDVKDAIADSVADLYWVLE
jgi:uncharacterized iron-regulated protein